MERAEPAGNHRSWRSELDDKVPSEQMFNHSDNSGATKGYHRATDAHLGPVKPSGTTGKSLIVLNPGLSLNQRVPGSSPGAPTTQKVFFSKSFAKRRPRTKRVSCDAFCGRTSHAGRGTVGAKKQPPTRPDAGRTLQHCRSTISGRSGRRACRTDLASSSGLAYRAVFRKRPGLTPIARVKALVKLAWPENRQVREMSAREVSE